MGVREPDRMASALGHLTAGWQGRRGARAGQDPVCSSPVKATEKQSPLSGVFQPMRSHDEGPLGLCSFSLLPAFLPISHGLCLPHPCSSVCCLSCLALLLLEWHISNWCALWFQGLARALRTFIFHALTQIMICTRICIFWIL